MEWGREYWDIFLIAVVVVIVFGVIHCAPTCVTRGLDHASRIYPTCAPKTPEIG
jgi:hypothetical protein